MRRVSGGADPNLGLAEALDADLVISPQPARRYWVC